MPTTRCRMHTCSRTPQRVASAFPEPCRALSRTVSSLGQNTGFVVEFIRGIIEHVWDCRVAYIGAAPFFVITAAIAAYTIFVVSSDLDHKQKSGLRSAQ